MAFAQNRVNTSVLQRFGAPVQLDGVTVQGDFTAAEKERDVGGMPMSALDPMCTVADGDVPDAPVGKALVHGATTYTVTAVKSDGLGLTVLTLRKSL